MDKTAIKTEELIETVIEGARERKGKDIVSMDLRNLDSSVCDYFVICTAESERQGQSIALSIKEQVEEDFNRKIHSIEGYNNGKWILMDLLEVVVHIFQPNFREFYNLEDLWADAKINEFQNIE